MSSSEDARPDASDTASSSSSTPAAPHPMDSLIASLETALSSTPYGIEGIDSEDVRVGTIATLNRTFMSSREDWYGTALHYWDDTEPTVSGMLGGFANLSPSDLSASTRFLQHLHQTIRPNLRMAVSCECGAGIGRVTKGLFVPLDFARCDLVEVSAALISCSPEYIGDPGSSRCKFYCIGLQSFDPKPSTYDVVWVQWCVGYLTDVDCVKFLHRMGKSLRDDGVVVIKDNTCTGDAFVLDRDDSSVTRSLDYLLALAHLAGLRVVYQRMQGEDDDGEERFPDDIFPVPMIALEVAKKD